MHRIANPRYVKIPCRACGIQALVIEGQTWPKRCIRCGTGFRLESRAFEALPDPGPETLAPGVPGPRGRNPRARSIVEWNVGRCRLHAETSRPRIRGASRPA